MVGFNGISNRINVYLYSVLAAQVGTNISTGIFSTLSISLSLKSNISKRTQLKIGLMGLIPLGKLKRWREYYNINVQYSK